MNHFTNLANGMISQLMFRTSQFFSFQVYNLVEGPKDYQNRLKTAADIRKDIEATFKTVSDANDILAKLLSDDKKAELAEEVSNFFKLHYCGRREELIEKQMIKKLVKIIFTTDQNYSISFIFWGDWSKSRSYRWGPVRGKWRSHGIK